MIIYISQAKEILEETNRLVMIMTLNKIRIVNFFQGSNKYILLSERALYHRFFSNLGMVEK